MNRIKTLVLSMLWLVATNLSAQTFTEVTVSAFETMTDASAEWADFDNDGYPDLFVAGTNGSGVSKVRIYFNNGDDTFNTLNLVDREDVAFDFGDYNHDGYIDILLFGEADDGSKNFQVFKNNNGVSFTAQAFGLTAITKGGARWADIDADGDLDIVAAGLDQLSNEQVLFYRYEDGAYEPVTLSTNLFSLGTVDVLDANNDGIIEVLFTGLDEGGDALSTIYSISKDWTISTYTTAVAGYAISSSTLGDYNEDGYVDLALTGFTESSATSSDLFTNNGTSFTQVATFLQGMSSSSTVFADLDNDGLLDMLLCGLNSPTVYFEYSKNAESGGSYTFTTTANTLENIYNGDIAIADYDLDGDLDVFQVGNSDVSYQANLYASDIATTIVNNAPTVPVLNTAVSQGDSVTLSWNTVTDDLTNPNSITYNVYVSQDAGGNNLIVSPDADISNGYRRTHTFGNAGFRTTLQLNDLPEGIYYWSAQALDGQFKGSAFGTEGSFTVCHPLSIGNDTTICLNESVQISVTDPEATVVNWYSKADGLQLSASLTYEHTVTKQDTLIAEVTKTYGCVRYDTLIVSVYDLPDYYLGNDTTICYGEEFNLSVTDLDIVGLDSVNWYSTNQGSLLEDSETLSYEVLEKDTLIAEVFNINGCVNYDSLIVEVYELPSYYLGNDTTICYGEYFDLSVTDLGILGLDSVNWYSTLSGILVQDSENLNYEVLEKDTLIAEVFNVNGCVNYDSLIVSVYALPDYDIGNDTTICYGQFFDLSVTDLGIAGLDSVNWYSTNLGSLIEYSEDLSYEVLEKDTLIAEVFNVNGCVNYDSLIISVYALPVFDIGADTALCFGSSIVLETGILYDEVNWYALANSETLITDSWFYDYTASFTDTLIAEVYDVNRCLNYDTIRIVMNPLPDHTIGEDQNICSGDTVRLAVTGIWPEVNWLTTTDQVLKEESDTYEYKVEETLTLWSEVFTDKGCVTYDTITVTELELPIFDLPEEAIYCFGDSIELEVGVGTTFAWRNETELLSAASSWKTIANTTDLVSLYLEDENACKYSDTLTVIVNPLPEFEIAGPTEICLYDSTDLSIAFTNLDSIHWYSDEESLLYNETTLRFTAPADSWVYADLIDNNQCLSSDSVFVIINERPQALAGKDSLICTSTTLQLGEDYTESDWVYNWTPTETLTEINNHRPTAAPSTETTYYLEVINAKGCNAFDTVVIAVNPPITILAGADAAICLGDEMTLGGETTATGSLFVYEYLWTSTETIRNPETSNPVIAPTVTADYILEVRSAYCPSEHDTITVVVNYAPEITVSPQQSVGADESVTIAATGGEHYQWTPDNTLDDAFIANPEASPLVTTIYEVLVIDTNGCESTGEVSVLVQNVLFIPNLFTPNRDQNNDTFMVYGSGIATIAFQVYDISGNKIYQTDDVTEATTNGWDGTYRGEPMPSGTYLWSISGQYHNGTNLQFSGKTQGTIKLLR